MPFLVLRQTHCVACAIPTKKAGIADLSPQYIKIAKYYTGLKDSNNWQIYPWVQGSRHVYNTGSLKNCWYIILFQFPKYFASAR